MKKKKIPDQYTSLASKPTHLYTIFTEMVAHYCHFSSENSPSPYQHRNNGSLLYLEQFQNHPIGIPKMAKMHLKTFEHPRKSFFREYPPGPTTYTWIPCPNNIHNFRYQCVIIFWEKWKKSHKYIRGCHTPLRTLFVLCWGTPFHLVGPV